MDVAEYADKAGFKIERTGMGEGWDTDDSGWMHYKMRIRVKSKHGQMTIPWKQGTAHGTDTPSVADVVGSLISDGMAYESAPTLEDFAADFGYDTTDPIKKREVQKIHTMLKHSHPKIVKLFGGKEEWDWVSENLDY